MTEFAAVVLAHSDPEHLHRLVAALERTPVFLHCDRATPQPTYRDLVANLPDTVTVLPRRRTSLASWTLVEAELDGLRAALAATEAQHLVVMSGSDYPLASTAVIRAALERWAGRSLVQLSPLPFDSWSTGRHPDGGMWRFDRHFFTARGRPIRFGRTPLRWPVRRQVPAELRLCASAQWKVLARPHAEALLTVLDDRPDLRRFWRTTFVPEESCVTSIIASPRLVGTLANDVTNYLPWFIRWEPRGAEHPKQLTTRDFDAIARAAGSDTEPGADADRASPDEIPKLFARKFSSQVGRGVLDMIDAQLRRRSVPA